MSNDCPRSIERSASQLFFRNKKSLEYKALLTVSTLPHPQRPILASFIQNAVDREVAAEFLLHEVAIRDLFEVLGEWIALAENFRPVVAADLNDNLREALMQRHGGTCCFSRPGVHSTGSGGLVAAFIVPPDLFDRFKETPRLHRMLEAFIGRDQVVELQAMLKSSSSTKGSERLLLLSRDAFCLFRNGQLSLRAIGLGDIDRYTIAPNFLLEPMPEWVSRVIVSLSETSGGLSAAPSPLLLEANHRFFKTLAWIEVAEHMKAHPLPNSRCEKRSPGTQSLRPILSMLLHIWLRMPPVVRSFVYERLMRVGYHLYGATVSQRVHRLPFNLYLRVGSADWHPRHQSEFEALRLVERYTKIPAPRAVDACQYRGKSYLLMTRIPGRPIGQLLNQWTDEQLRKTTDQLRGYLAELRSIPDRWTASNGRRICSASGDGILDWRIGDSQHRELKFATIADFHESLISGYSEAAREEARVSHSKKHDIVFTHGDLNPRNILADETGRITGIVDWECAAWMPGYWEYTKMHFVVRSNIRWLADVVDQLFDGYREELRVENMLTDNGRFL